MGLNHEERQIEQLLKEHGAMLVNDRGHLKYKFPDGRTFTMSATPSDGRAAKNKLHDLRLFIGIERPTKKRLTGRTKESQLSIQNVRPILNWQAQAIANDLRTMASELKKLYKGEYDGA